MRNLHELDHVRDRSADVIAFFGSVGDHETGAFWIRSPIDRVPMRVLASAGEGWDHVSVSRHNRCPNWPEMEHVKRLFFRPDEVCMQLHVAVEDHISIHPNCLHIWRPHAASIPLPPKWMVG